MNKVLEELDNQEIHLRRLARRIDALSAPGSNLELRVSAMMHGCLHDLHQPWDDNDEPLPGWGDTTSIAVSRVGVQRAAIDLLAGEAERRGAAISAEALAGERKEGRERMPFALDTKFHDAPLVIPPDALERDYYELVFNPQQEAILKIDNALDGLERKSKSRPAGASADHGPIFTRVAMCVAKDSPVSGPLRGSRVVQGAVLSRARRRRG